MGVTTTRLDDGNNQVRIPGHGYSIWVWNNHPIAYAVNVQHRSPQPRGQAIDVQPLNYVRPMEIVTGRAITRGEITMTVLEIIGHKPWDHFVGLDDSWNDLADVFHYFRRDYSEFSKTNSGNLKPTFMRVVRDPSGGPNGIKTEIYKGIAILDVREDEDTAIDTTLNQFQVTIGYTHKVTETSSTSVRNEDEVTTIRNNKVY